MAYSRFVVVFCCFPKLSLIFIVGVPGKPRKFHNICICKSPSKVYRVFLDYFFCFNRFLRGELLSFAQAYLLAVEPRCLNSFFGSLVEIRHFLFRLFKSFSYLLLRQKFDKTLSVDLTEKVTLTIGLEEHSYRDGLVINADVKYRWDDAGYDDPYYYGIVFTPSSGSMWYSRVNDDRIWGVASAECNRNYQTQYVAGRTFDMCVPAPYLNSTDFGAMWVWTRSIYESPTPKTMQLHMNVIRLPDGTDGMGRPNGDGTLLGVAVVDIVPDLEHGTFSFQNLRSNESVTAGDLTAEQRDTVIEEAMAFAYQGNNSWFGITENDISYEHNIIVERVNDTYYDIKFNTKGDVINRNWLPDCDKMYAVNIPLKGMGYLTIYVTEKNGSYAAAAYDALCPLSIEDIANYMDESDFIAFGLNFYG